MTEQANLQAAILDALPQTQCTRCGYPDCAAYAEAIALRGEGIGHCPPGGAEGVRRLAQITGRPEVPLDPANGAEGPRLLAVIDEAWCIGCTLCIEACPTDAIMGTNKRMHTVIEPYCTGCELCVPVCPVDCIALVNASGVLTGWDAWSDGQASIARRRHEARASRLEREKTEHEGRLERKAQEKLANLPALTHGASGAELERKRQVVEAALERARARRAQGGKT